MSRSHSRWRPSLLQTRRTATRTCSCGFRPHTFVCPLCQQTKCWFQGCADEWGELCDDCASVAWGWSAARQERLRAALDAGEDVSERGLNDA
jgi:hypothetical protein